MVTALSIHKTPGQHHLISTSVKLSGRLTLMVAVSDLIVATNDP